MTVMGLCDREFVSFILFFCGGLLSDAISGCHDYYKSFYLKIINSKYKIRQQECQDLEGFC
jgi:hypothetical protein